MIIDALNNLKDYVSLNPLFKDVVEFIQKTDLASQEPGIVKIQGDDLFANFTVANGKTPDQAKLETHDKMIDIQKMEGCINLTLGKAFPLDPFLCQFV